MCPRLNSSVTLHALAAELHLDLSANPTQVLLSYCHRRVRRFLEDYGECSTVSELLGLLVNKLDTRMIEIKSGEELNGLKSLSVERGELIFATLDRELAGTEDYGITLRLTNPMPGEQAYVSIVDCRGRKGQRKYHTKWHEIVHLLILTDQSRQTFRRSHNFKQPKAAEESLVDFIAGELSFYPDLIRPHLEGRISFERIEQVREALCPEASLYSAILNLSKLWPTSCIWVEAQLAVKKADETTQERFLFREPPERTLRAVHTAANDPARECGLNIIPRFRVPKNSVISRVFEQGISIGEACEDLAWWESSDGKRLNSCKVRVQAKRVGESVHALVVPSE